MGTNFYFFTRNKKLKDKYPGEWELTDRPDFGYTLHLAKTSMGWLPIFQGDRYGFINSVKDIKTVYDTGLVDIIDEYGDVYDWEAFTERVIKWNGGTVEFRTVEQIAEEEISRQKEYDFYDPNMPPWVPVSHFEYGGIAKHPETLSHYFKDDEGYEFTDTQFS